MTSLLYAVAVPGAQRSSGEIWTSGRELEKVADEALEAYEAFERTGAAVDRHLADQFLLPLALAAGRSRFTTDAVTEHLLTNAAVIRQFLPDCAIDIRGKKGQMGTVEVAGVAFRAG